MYRDKICILDFGGSQSQIVARKLRGERVYCEVLPCDTPADVIRAKAPKGLMLVGKPRKEGENSHTCQSGIFALNIPILAMGSASLELLSFMGGQSLGTAISEQTATVTFQPCLLFEGLPRSDRYIHRMDDIRLWEGAQPLGMVDSVIAAFGDLSRGVYGAQFLAEQNDLDGLTVLSNFARNICGCQPTWSMEAFMESAIDSIREKVGESSALMAISGGVDSSVCAALMHRAIGDRIHCLFVNTGLMRKGEPEAVRDMFRRMGMEIDMVEAGSRFLNRLQGVTDPAAKRRIIDDEFARIFDNEARRYGQVDCLVQGTIYSDIIESYGPSPSAARAPVFGVLPPHLHFKKALLPVKELFKDEVRDLGYALGMPPEIINRPPFPGPGLAVRCLGEVTEEKLSVLREADAIFREEIRAAGLDKRVAQFFAVLTDTQSIGVRNGVRTSSYTVALRAVNTVSATAATAFRMPYDLLERVVERITTEIPRVNRVVYDITGKPPAAVEWE